MRTLMMSAALALSAFSFSAMADGLVSLTDKQMDTVTAGQQEFIAGGGLLLPAPGAVQNPNDPYGPDDPGSDNFLRSVHFEPEGLGRFPDDRLNNTPNNP